jgi:hypothetical protein
MRLHELNIAIAQAAKLPKPKAQIPQTVRRNGEKLPKGIYRGYQGRFVAMPSLNGRPKYLGTFAKISSAEAAIVRFTETSKP